MRMWMLLLAGWPMLGLAAPVVESAWVRAVPAVVPHSAAYFSLDNRGGPSDELIGLASPQAAAVELHESRTTGGQMRMVPVPTLALAPGQRVVLQPGGLHAMLIDLKRPLKAGERVPLRLHFRRAGVIQVQAVVRDVAAEGDAAGSHTHHHHH